MTYKNRTLIKCILGGLVCCLPVPFTLTASSKRVQFTAQELNSARQERANYQKCRKKALRKAKKFKPKKRARFMKLAAINCREQFPAISILNSCKKEAVNNYKDRPEYLKAALNECREELKLYMYNPDQIVPFKQKADKTFFAGAGLNDPLRLSFITSRKKIESENKQEDPVVVKSYSFGNFNCQEFGKTLHDKKDADYLLFSNNLDTYLPFRSLNFDQLRELMPNPKQRAKGESSDVATASKPVEAANLEGYQFVHPQWGEVTVDEKNRKISQYFPISFCHFDRELGNLYEDIKIYYILEPKRNLGMPYFGIAFYNPEASIKLDTLLEAVQKQLGPSFSIQHESENLKFLAESKINSFDSDDDPANLCQSPREHTKMAIISFDKVSQNVNYFLLSNLQNLCKYGDRLASHLLKNGL